MPASAEGPDSKVAVSDSVEIFEPLVGPSQRHLKQQSGSSLPQITGRGRSLTIHGSKN